MSTRTPGPWEALPQNGAGPMLVHRYATGQQMKPTALRLIAHLLERGSSLSEDQANATFIVTACNAHDELVAALRHAVEVHGEPDGSHDFQWVKDARAALAKVKA